MNNKYEIEIKDPLIRPGITIRTTCSERYVVPVLDKIMNLIREYNNERVYSDKKE